MRALSDLAATAIYAANTAEIFCLLLEISHSSITTKRYVNLRQSLVSNGYTYEPRAFICFLPNESQGAIPRVNLSIDNVDREISDLIRALPAESEATVKISVILKSDPDTIEVGPFIFDNKQATYDRTIAVLTLSHQDFLTLSFPGLEFSPSTHPALYGVTA